MPIIIHLKQPISLGLGFGALVLKPGTHEIPDHYKDKWYFKSLVASGKITVDSETPEIAPNDLLDVDVTGDGVVVMGSSGEEGDVHVTDDQVPQEVDVQASVEVSDATKPSTKTKIVRSGKKG
jgi:hypothetical protein